MCGIDRSSATMIRAPRENMVINSRCVSSFAASRKRLLKETRSITPEANPREKPTTRSLILPSKREIKPPIPVAIPATRLRRNGSNTKFI